MATIGLSKPYYAVYSNTGTTVSYANGGVMGKATEANIEVETTEDNNLYADNAIAETDRSFAGGTLTLSTDDLSQEVSKSHPRHQGRSPHRDHRRHRRRRKRADL